MLQDFPVKAGQTVHVGYTKWGERPHWVYDNVLLGTDGHGVWTAGPAGTPMSRPGLAFDAGAGFVNCFSRTSGWVATFCSYSGVDSAAKVYVDITTVPVWSRRGSGGAEVTMVDLDLDVIQRFDGELFIDDEDEFAEHQLSYGYPVELVEAAEHGCRSVYRAMESGDEPFGAVGPGWLRRYVGTAEQPDDQGRLGRH